MAQSRTQSDAKEIRTPRGVLMVYANDMYCSYCPMVFSSVTGKKRHEMYHDGTTPFLCENCQVSFTRSARLTKHRVICHSIDLLGKDIKWCSFCDNFSRKDEYLKKHYRKYHGILYDSKNPHVFKSIKQCGIENNSLLLCEVCGESFQSSFLLGRHRYGAHKIRSSDPVVGVKSSKDYHLTSNNTKYSKIEHDSLSSEDINVVDLSPSVQHLKQLQKVSKNTAVEDSDDDPFYGFSS